MDGSLGHFRATQQRRQERRSNKQAHFTQDGNLHEHPNDHKSIIEPDISKEELEKIKAEIRINKQKHRTRELVLYVFVSVVIIGIALWTIL
ncbi:MAG: hypothetical protein GC178_05075 [Flavobacteriales bacterium]|nr:hypothetical protein [Flavobacteriales bacterium]